MNARGSCTRMLSLLLLFLCLLSGCVGEQSESDLALQLRTDFLSRSGCTGEVMLTADYGQRVYEYTLTFSETEKEGLVLVLTAPESVAGITATVAQGETALTFDGVQLETGPLNDEGLSPLDALPTFFSAMESGFIAETGTEPLGQIQALRLCFRQPEKRPGQGLETVLWFDTETKALVQGEVRSDGKTVIRGNFSSFLLIAKTQQETGTEPTDRPEV